MTERSVTISVPSARRIHTAFVQEVVHWLHLVSILQQPELQSGKGPSNAINMRCRGSISMNYRILCHHHLLLRMTPECLLCAEIQLFASPLAARRIKTQKCG
jgi:hypothetical protein